MEYVAQAAMVAFFGWQAVQVHRSMPATIKDWDYLITKAHRREEMDRAVAARRKARAAIEAAGGGWYAQQRAMDAVARINWSSDSVPVQWGTRHDAASYDTAA